MLNWSCETIAPISVLGSNGSPTFILLAKVAIFSTNSSCIFFSTNSLLAAQQHSPWLKYMPMREPFIADSMSASAKTILGLFPPSSRDTLFRVSEAARMMDLPVVVSPVKATLSVSGCWARAVPTVSPGPVTMFSTPSGRPASMISSPRRRQVRVVNLEGLSTTVLPQARAGPSFQAAIRRGKFQGMICPTTPTGSLRV